MVFLEKKEITDKISEDIVSSYRSGISMYDRNYSIIRSILFFKILEGRHDKFLRFSSRPEAQEE